MSLHINLIGAQKSNFSFNGDEINALNYLIQRFKSIWDLKERSELI